MRRQSASDNRNSAKIPAAEFQQNSGARHGPSQVPNPAPCRDCPVLPRTAGQGEQQDPIPHNQLRFSNKTLCNTSAEGSKYLLSNNHIPNVLLSNGALPKRLPTIQQHGKLQLPSWSVSATTLHSCPGCPKPLLPPAPCPGSLGGTGKRRLPPFHLLALPELAGVTPPNQDR